MCDVLGVTVYAQKKGTNSGGDGPAWLPFSTVEVQRGSTIAESTAFFYSSVQPKGLTKCEGGSLSHTNCSSKYFNNKEINKLCSILAPAVEANNNNNNRQQQQPPTTTTANNTTTTTNNNNNHYTSQLCHPLCHPSQASLHLCHSSRVSRCLCHLLCHAIFYAIRVE
jgi:hypothetical protein